MEIAAPLHSPARGATSPLAQTGFDPPHHGLAKDPRYKVPDMAFPWAQRLAGAVGSLWRGLRLTGEKPPLPLLALPCFHGKGGHGGLGVGHLRTPPSPPATT